MPNFQEHFEPIAQMCVKDLLYSSCVRGANGFGKSCGKVLHNGLSQLVSFKFF